MKSGAEEAGLQPTSPRRFDFVITDPLQGLVSDDGDDTVAVIEAKSGPFAMRCQPAPIDIAHRGQEQRPVDFDADRAAAALDRIETRQETQADALANVSARLVALETWRHRRW